MTSGASSAGKGPIRAVDLFAGCGGLSVGLSRGGVEVVAAADNWEPALRIYRDNFRHPIEDIDLGDPRVASEFVGSFAPDLIAGGPPCQDFSSAGKRDEDLGRGDLTVSFATIVATVGPPLFLMENVERLPKTRKFAEAMSIFRQAGYGLTEFLLDASRYGCPQKRRRYFVIGHLGGIDGQFDFILDDASDQEMTVREYLTSHGRSLDTDFYYRHPRNYNRRGIFSIDEPSPTVRGVNRPIPKGYPGHHRDATHDLRRVRPLTTVERSWVQTFPFDFNLGGTKTDLEQAIGNAVPVNLASAIARRLDEAWRGMDSRHLSLA